MGNICLKNVDFYVVSDQFSQNNIIQNDVKYANLTVDGSARVKDYNLNLIEIEKITKNKILQLEASTPTVIAPNSEKLINFQNRYPVDVAGDYAVETQSACSGVDVIFGKSASTFNKNCSHFIKRICDPSDQPVNIPAGVRLVNSVQVTVPDTRFKLASQQEG